MFVFFLFIIIVVQLSESSRSPKIQIKYYERYFSVVLFILLYNFTLYSESIYQILKCNRLSGWQYFFYSSVK